MLILFKKIRKYAIDSGRLGRYSAYAVGEIILVVIGILIAIQIDDWTDSIQETELETKVLREIQTNLKTDLKEIRADITLMVMVEENALKLLDYLKSNSEGSDDFYYYASRLRVIPHFDETRSGYSLLQASGVGLIKNDLIRDKLSELYEFYYPYYATYERERMDFHREHSMPMLLKYFYMPLDYTSKEDWLDYKFTASPSDYIKLREDESFIKTVHAVVMENSTILKRAYRLEDMILDLIALIQTDLDQREAKS